MSDLFLAKINRYLLLILSKFKHINIKENFLRNIGRDTKKI